MADSSLIEQLKSLRWDVVQRVHGNAHHTLISLCVAWWISFGISLGKNYDAFEEFSDGGGGERGEGRGQCDAILCEGSVPIGMLEVEGILQRNPKRYYETMNKVARFLKSNMGDFEKLQFALVFLYPTGFADARPVITPERLAHAVQISKEAPGKKLLLVEIEKTYAQYPVGSIRARYSGTPRAARGMLIENGTVGTPVNYFRVGV
ncbi:MAG TPA: hypothetical protein VGM65_16340 [Candidatus Udaeobacter sp.]|jgi:hypothetical protein